ncbi:transcriptional regulator [Actinomadura craniellae]|uniref:Transcriptional regulator n=1 Tax=Actinomadura craniellae TaxID=2231787 RepID=A0A365GWU0_9ACTN|nr:metalloregulator ArsR/SmtB family transcription factor [Actinomadura craniellae]RAY11242.1 transcriptional regulator [Actinomadura craniellae]
MHLIPRERAQRSTIDDHQACRAAAGIGDPARTAAWARRFDLLADPGRLTLLLAIEAAGPIAVTDLAIATGISDTAVSQALRVLRTAGVVEGRRDGRVVRYAMSDPEVSALLRRIG